MVAPKCSDGGLGRKRAEGFEASRVVGHSTGPLRSPICRFRRG
jgi:hypothetical protein